MDINIVTENKNPREMVISKIETNKEFLDEFQKQVDLSKLRLVKFELKDDSFDIRIML